MNELPKYLAGSVAVKTACDYSARRFTFFNMPAEPTISIGIEDYKNLVGDANTFGFGHTTTNSPMRVSMVKRGVFEFQMPALNER